MVREMPITEARNALTSLPARLAREPGAVVLTRRGRPVLALLPWDLYDALIETLEVMGDAELMEALRRSIQEANEGKTIPWARVKAKLGPDAAWSIVRCCP